MNPILADFQNRGITLSLDGDPIRWEGPAGAMTPADLSALRAHKPEILEALRTPAPVGTAPHSLAGTKSFCPSCHRSDRVRMPRLTGMPTPGWLNQLSGELGECQTCRVFMAATVILPPWLTAKQQRQAAHLIEAG